jgi:hypothetical protein
MLVIMGLIFRPMSTTCHRLFMGVGYIVGCLLVLLCMYGNKRKGKVVAIPNIMLK